MSKPQAYNLTKKQAYLIIGASYGAKTVATIALFNFPMALAFAAGAGVVAAGVDQVLKGKNSYLFRSCRFLNHIGVRGILLPFKIVGLDLLDRGRKIAAWRPFKAKPAANDNAPNTVVAAPQAASALAEKAAQASFNAAVAPQVQAPQAVVAKLEAGPKSP